MNDVCFMQFYNSDALQYTTMLGLFQWKITAVYKYYIHSIQYTLRTFEA